ncbi:unnamed protein product, partial [Candidula unifasciata]
MPVRKEDAHRALELLEDYLTRLNKPQDRPLKTAIERVIRIFKSRLFQALLDIQEFYESTLLDENKTSQEKTLETLRIASKWEREQPFTHNHSKAERNNAIDEEDLPPPPPEISHVRPAPSPVGEDRPGSKASLAVTSRMVWEIKEKRKPSIVLMMLSWLHFRYTGRPHQRSSRSVSFKKYVDLITYDREYLVSFL